MVTSAYYTAGETPRAPRSVFAQLCCYSASSFLSILLASGSLIYLCLGTASTIPVLGLIQSEASALLFSGNNQPYAAYAPSPSASFTRILSLIAFAGSPRKTSSRKSCKISSTALFRFSLVASMGRSEQISFSSPISPWRYFSRAQVWLLPSQPNAKLLFRSFNAVSAPVFAQQAQHGILIC